MFAQVVSGTLFQPDRFDEVKAAFEAGAVHGMRAHKGFCKAYLLQASDNPSEAMVIMLWDCPENAAAATARADYLIQSYKVIQQLQRTERKSYEVVAEG